jgi:FkbM family methyltransferase
MNINFENLTNQVKPRGVIHVGANTCQELPLYLAHGIENRLWIEPNDSLEFPEGETIIHTAISNRVSSHDFMYSASNNGESSSLLEPWHHLEKYKDIDFGGKVLHTQVTTLENIIDMSVMHPPKFNYLVLDIQGNELRALKGLGFHQSHFEVIITEAYTEELYRGCGKLHEIEAFLSNYQLVEFAEEVGKGWGDAAFIRKDLLK